jgi:DNA-binding MarR family transcriptional regulator/GNAT superfamily N-acetyltransferase
MTDVAAFRRFNRMYTKLIGTLNEGMLSTEYSLPEARVIYELGTHAASNATEIADALGMDPGYLSRVLGKFESGGLVSRKASQQDNRRADLSLTRRGRAAFERLNTRAERHARGILDGLTVSDRAQLIRSMRTIEDLLVKDAPARPPYILRPHRPGDMGWVVHLEGAAYAAEYGWDDTFEALVARIVADFVMNFDPKMERCWVAEVDGQPVGHIFLVKHPEETGTAKLRLLFVDKSARGKGLGQVLVDECVKFARAVGYRKVTLWTQSILAAAHHCYGRAGFRMVRQEGHHSFGKDLIGQTWDLKL